MQLRQSRRLVQALRFIERAEKRPRRRLRFARALGLERGRLRCSCKPRRAEAYAYDEEGRRYIDYVMAYGPLLFGHTHPALIDGLDALARKDSSGARRTPKRFASPNAFARTCRRWSACGSSRPAPKR